MFLEFFRNSLGQHPWEGRIIPVAPGGEAFPPVTLFTQCLVCDLCLSHLHLFVLACSKE